MRNDRRRSRQPAHSNRHRLMALAGLLALLILAGCSARIETSIVVHVDDTWTGQVHLYLPVPSQPSAAAEALDEEVEQQFAALLHGRTIDYHWERELTPEGIAHYALWTKGADLRALAGIAFAEGSITERLGGPVLLELRGNVEQGELLTLALPANLSTGFSWAVEPQEENSLVQLEEIESRQIDAGPGGPARQVIRLQALTTGPAVLRLVYRRPWEPDAVPDRVLTLQGQDLAALLAALSLPPAPAIAPGTMLGSAARDTIPTSSVVSEPAQALPPAYNWCDHGGCTPIKDQKNCGSCWAFATAGVVESNISIHDGVTRDLAEQYLVSCNVDGWSCDGGGRAFDYYLDVVPPGEPGAGAVYEADFPYVASNAPCNPPHPHHEKIRSWAYVGFGIPPAADIKQAIYDHGPVYVSVCVGPFFQLYRSGVFAIDESIVCDGFNGTNHGVVLVGWDDSQGTNGVWILKNSWGTWWGENGYMRIAYGTSNVGRWPAYVVYAPQPQPTHWVYLPLVFKQN